MKARKKQSLLNGLVSMSDLMFSLSAGLLVMGVFGATNPDHEKEFAQLLQQLAIVEQSATDADDVTRSLAERFLTLLENERDESSPPAVEQPAVQSANLRPPTTPITPGVIETPDNIEIPSPFTSLTPSTP